MFTGLVQTLGAVVDLTAEAPAIRLVIRAPAVVDGLELGASVAVNGCCLTVVHIGVDRGEIQFEAGQETLSRTNLGQLKHGSSVNLERSLKLGDELGGHLVTGHIDGLGYLDERRDDGPWSTMWFRAEPQLLGQMASKGSVCVDGISLTLVEVRPTRFSVALIPHTLAMTTLGHLQPGGAVNLETDLLAKYVQRQLEAVRKQ